MLKLLSFWLPFVNGVTLVAIAMGDPLVWAEIAPPHPPRPLWLDVVGRWVITWALVLGYEAVMYLRHAVTHYRKHGVKS